MNYIIQTTLVFVAITALFTCFKITATVPVAHKYKWLLWL